MCSFLLCESIELISEKAAQMNSPKPPHSVQVKIYSKMEISYLALSTALPFFEVVAVLRMTDFYFMWHVEGQRLER